MTFQTQTFETVRILANKARGNGLNARDYLFEAMESPDLDAESLNRLLWIAADFQIEADRAAQGARIAMGIESAGHRSHIGGGAEMCKTFLALDGFAV